MEIALLFRTKKRDRMFMETNWKQGTCTLHWHCHQAGREGVGYVVVTIFVCRKGKIREEMMYNQKVDDGYYYPGGDIWDGETSRIDYPDCRLNVETSC
jgi:hypothetical protein